MKTGFNTYKGLTSDIARDSIKNGFYIDALDIRITTDLGNSQGAITNIRGNKSYFSLPTTDPVLTVVGIIEIIGVAAIRNLITVFLTDDSNSNGWIYTFDYNDITTVPGALTLRYRDEDLKFSKSNPIDAYGRFESNSIQRVYWTDYNNFFRSVNLFDTNLLTTPVGLIDLFPDINYTQPLLKKVLGGGGLLTGNHQYAFRLLTFDGKQTLISPPSIMISAVQDSETVVSTAEYNGNSKGVNTFKSHEIEIDTSSYTQFESIELIHIFHDDITLTPQVFSVETKQIEGASIITFVHTGTENTITTLTLDDYTSRQYPFKTPKTIVEKDSSLIIANIKESQFDAQELLDSLSETFDAKTKRFDSSQATDPALSTPLDLAFNKNYNKDAHWEASWHVDEQFKYQSDGLRLGGSGANISYTFHLEPYLIDGDARAESPGLGNGPVATHNFNDGYGNYANTTFDSQASPFISGLIRGCKRGETYRVGIIFNNIKGESSFVEYIGDIKFPDISDTDSVNNLSGTDYFPLSRETFRNTPSEIQTSAYALGLKFTIDFSTCPQFLTQIESYQIVRVKRESGDTRRLCSGIMKVAMKHDIEADSSTGGSQFDLRGPGETEDIVHLFPIQQARDTSDVAIAPGFGANANFATLNHIKSTSLPFPIQGSYLTFYSPEISHEYLSTITETIAGNACLLMTGRYGQYYSKLSSSTSGETVDPTDNGFKDDIFSYDIITSFDTNATEGLGDKMDDHRRKMRTTGQVNKTVAVGVYATDERGVEYIKQWKSNASVQYHRNTIISSDLDAELATALGPYPGEDHLGNSVDYYFRNFYGYIGNSKAGLNFHDETAQRFLSTFNKGASGITGTMEKITNDPLLGTPVSKIPATDYFSSYGTNSYVDSIADSIGPLNGTVDEENLTSTPAIDILIPRIEVYGGFTQNALDGNTFMPMSPVIRKANLTPAVFGGDVFLNMWVFQEGVGWLDARFYAFSGAPSDEDFDQNRTDTNTFAVESRVNTELSYGATIKTEVEYNAPGGSSGVLHEQWRQETNNTITTFGKTATDGSINMYKGVYNNAYSIESDDVGFFSKPSNFNTVDTVNDLRAFLSNVKTNNEPIDSWTKFGANNFRDVDDYGPINKILAWNDNIFYFQDRAVGRYVINPVAQVSTASGESVQLGTGKGFQDHIYMSTENGAIHQWGIKETDRGIYYFDGIHEKIFKIGSGLEPVSEVKGMHGFLKTLEGPISLRKENGGDNPILNKGVLVTKDMINNEVIFTFLGTNLAGTEKKTLVYDEIAQQFSSRFSATPPVYIENGDILLSVNPSNRTDIYQHNVGNWGEFYGIQVEASIKLIINSDADLNKMLRVIEFNSVVKDDNGVIDREQTITAFQVETEYQDTGKVLFTSGRIKRRFEKWRFNNLRDIANGNRTPLRSTHFILTLYFDNTFNKELILNRILHHYDVQVY